MGANYRRITRDKFGHDILEGRNPTADYYDCFCSEDEVKDCKWIESGDRVRKVVNNVYEIRKPSGKFFKINKIGDIFITAAHCLNEKHVSFCVKDHDIAIYNTATGEKGDAMWQIFRNQLLKGKFNKEIYNMIMSEFKPGDSGLLCILSDQINVQQRKLLQVDPESTRGILLVSGGTDERVCNGLLPKQEMHGSTGSVVGSKWESRNSIERVFSGEGGGEEREMFGVKWLEFRKHCKILTKVVNPYHLLNSEEKKQADSLHQFPDLATDTVCDLKNIKRIKIPGENNDNCHEFDLNRKLVSWHETHNRLIFAILPAFEINNNPSFFKSGTPIFDADTNQLISCITKNYEGNVYAVSGIGWESGNIESDQHWLGVSCSYVGKNESIYGTFHGPYNKVKELAAAKALEPMGEKTGVGIYSQEKMVQVIAFDENGKERWRVRLFHENCKLADRTD